VALNAALFDEPLPDEIADVAFHPRAVASVSEPREIVCGNHAELAQVGERLESREGSSVRLSESRPESLYFLRRAAKSETS